MRGGGVFAPLRYCGYVTTLRAEQKDYVVTLDEAQSIL
jgi:hypothetical protein